MIELKTPGEIEAMHAAGMIVADPLATVQAEAKVGVSLLALDEVAQGGAGQEGRDLALPGLSARVCESCGRSPR